MHDHGHDHGNRDISNLKIAFALNALFAVVEVAGGLLTNSLAILSDALHDLGDTLALGISWILQKVSKRSRTPKHTYGYRRISLLSAFINTAIILGGSIVIVMRAIPRIIDPEEVQATGMLVLAVAGMVVNGIAVLRLRRGESLNERSVMLHLLEDVLGWAAVLVGSIVIMVFRIPVIDPILSLAVSVYVAVRAVVGMKGITDIFLQAVPHDQDVEAVEAAIREIPGVEGIHDSHLWSLDGTYNILTLHVIADAGMSREETGRLKGRIRESMASRNIEHVTIEIECPGDDCGMKDC